MSISNKIMCIHAMEYYKATKENELQLHTTTRITLTNRMLNQKHQAQRNPYCVVFFIESSKKGENQTIVLAVSKWLSLRKEEGELLGMRTGVVLHTDNVLFLDMDNSQFIYVLCTSLYEC